MKVFSAPIHVSRSLQRGQNSPFFNNHPAPIIGYPLTLRILLIPPTSRHLSLSLIVSRYITNVKNSKKTFQVIQIQEVLLDMLNMH